MVTAAMTPLMPGAGPPPTRMPSRLIELDEAMFRSGNRCLVASTSLHEGKEVPRRLRLLSRIGKRRANGNPSSPFEDNDAALSLANQSRYDSVNTRGGQVVPCR